MNSSLTRLASSLACQISTRSAAITTLSCALSAASSALNCDLTSSTRLLASSAIRNNFSANLQSRFSTANSLALSSALSGSKSLLFSSESSELMYPRSVFCRQSVEGEESLPKDYRQGRYTVERTTGRSPPAFEALTPRRWS